VLADVAPIEARDAHTSRADLITVHPDVTSEHDWRSAVGVAESTFGG
jgi:hypothetical protein